MGGPSGLAGRWPAWAVISRRRHLRPVPRPEERRLAELIDELGSGKFAVRQKAARALESLQDVAGPALRKALARKLTLEARRRIEPLLAELHGSRGRPAASGTVRALSPPGRARPAAGAPP